MKPATRFVGPFAMKSVTRLLVETAPAWARRPLGNAFQPVILAIGFVMLGFTPVHAGSATAQFRVSAQVVKSCNVSTATLASQAASANGTIKVNCQNSTAPAGSSGSADGVGGAVPSGTANVNYSVVEVPGSDGSLKIISVNF
ncbi:MAG TPA: hypothetical protein VK200_13025 [Candidatus Limnocylindrales bacterium]|nr:hypothetical protein [Candidatus Limnocylindrales bacterium]